MKVLTFLLLMFIIVTAGCVSQQVNQVGISTGSGQKIVNVEIADELQEWRAGLMNRLSLGKDDGMLFVFPGEQPRSFWMKNTLIPLDMIFISDKLEIIDIATMQPCRADPCPSYASKAPAKYVLEVNADYARSSNITLGNNVALYFRS